MYAKKFFAILKNAIVKHSALYLTVKRAQGPKYYTLREQLEIIRNCPTASQVLECRELLLHYYELHPVAELFSELKINYLMEMNAV